MMRQAAKVVAVMLGLVVVVFIAACVALFLGQRSLIYYPQPRGNTRDSVLMTLQTETGTVHVSTREAAGTKAVIYFGGNAEDTSMDAADLVEAFPGYAIYLMHYPGYGGSSGSPTEGGIIADALAVYDKVRAQHADIVVIGRSLGSGVAVHVASVRPVVRLVLVTPFDSLGDVAAANYTFLPVRWLLRDKFESWRYAPLVTAPTEVVAAANDEIVPRASTERLRTRFRNGVASYVVVPGVGHNTISESAEYWGLLKGE
jgi:uncharacterized protein